MTPRRTLPATAVYGHPDGDLAEVPLEALQLSPTEPGSPDLAALAATSLAAATAMAPPGTLERRHVLAHLLAAIRSGGPLTVLAPKDKGGSRLKRELEAFGCIVEETSKAHHRICRCVRPEVPVRLDEAIAAGALRHVPALGLWSQPGLFSWDRVDPGTALLVGVLPALTGRGADFGCGYGALARAVLASRDVAELTLVDNDRRAIAAARRNVEDARARFLWHDIARAPLAIRDLDFVVTNPPFHDGGSEDRALGQTFISRAAELLRPGGVLWLTANRHLPYEAVLRERFRTVTLRAEQGGYKVYEATR